MPSKSTSTAPQNVNKEKPRPVFTKHGIDIRTLPNNMDMSTGSITRIVNEINSKCSNDRTKFVMKSLVNHLHAFAQETSLTETEWMTAIEFLTDVGQTCTDLRQEFILLSDVLGLSTLVDSINHLKPPGATEATVLGPFYTDDAHDFKQGDSIASEGKGDYLFVEGRVLDLQGKPIPGAIIETWETDSFGLYDNQYEVREGPECRGRLRSGEDGSYAFRAVVPTSYPIPHDGPVGKLLDTLGRHPYRPAHLHFRIDAPGYESLTMALYWKHDPYITSDAVFGVKTSLLIDPETITDTQLTLSRGFKEARPHAYLKHDLILATPEECKKARRLLSLGESAGPLE
ncbi:hypothetical protein AX14_000823 [Amanita brunnescens Koide BX004]|nr:hypothetical protein AX14_000823 [Amanita brunnescens Koide BX004]